MLLVISCDNKATDINQEKAKQLVETSLNNMVTVNGGEFLMGGFGPLVEGKLPYSINRDDKKLHKVVLSDYMISKYKVTYADYEIYRKVTKRKSLHMSFGNDYPKIIAGNVSAAVT